MGGTTVFMQIDLDSQKTTADVYAEYTKAPDDFDFSGRRLFPCVQRATVTSNSYLGHKQNV